MTINKVNEPLTLFRNWFEEAKLSETVLPEAMSLASVGLNNRPSSRMVLLKNADERGFVFYTNLNSRKSIEMHSNNYVAGLFHWKSLKRQVRIEGEAELIDDIEADTYFQTRDRGAQIGAWASNQSNILKSRFELEKRIATYTAKFGIGKIKRPSFWSGFRIIPDKFEFWSEGRYRLHERLNYTRMNDEWILQQLFP